jgi:hypothetical protein
VEDIGDVQMFYMVISPEEGYGVVEEEIQRRTKRRVFTDFS